jgi:glutamate formiminotransferase / 5-formyltetrahydrofolate cyclo-ligase
LPPTQPPPADLLECVINVSEGRDPAVLAALRDAAGAPVLDLHTDPDHHRSVLTLAGSPGALQASVRAVATTAVATIDLRLHAGAHPRFGSLDVVPWVALAWRHGRLVDADPGTAEAARDEFAAWAGRELLLPCFLYGPERSLPAVRRDAWRDLLPDSGPPAPHPTAGSAAVGSRPLLVAYNLWLADADLTRARRIAAGLRGPQVRALGLQVGARVQVSCNLIAPLQAGPGAAFDAVSSQAQVARAELVGLVPQAVLDAEPPGRWAELGLDPSATIEARLEKAGLDGGSFG